MIQGLGVSDFVCQFFMLCLQVIMSLALRIGKFLLLDVDLLLYFGNSFQHALL
jgi:hypothetical protein